VHDLADEGDLLTWLAAAGLTVDEAARVQPSYCDAPVACICGGPYGSGPSVTAAEAVLEATITQSETGANANAHVVAVHGSTTRYAVGDNITVFRGALGQTVLVPIARATHSELAIEAGTDASDAAPHALESIPLTGSMPSECSEYRSQGRALSKDELIGALASNDCRAAVGTIDERWTTKDCGTGRACNMGPMAASPETIGILLALVGAIAARRTMRRSA